MASHHHTQPLPATRTHVHHAPRPMSRRVRATVMAVSAALWLSGSFWMILHYFMKARNELGDAPNPWEPSVVHIHGMIAVLMVFMLGWMGGTHVAIRWRRWRATVDGMILLIIAITLTLSGYALYYIVEDSPHQFASVIHQVFGVLVVIIAVIHWRTASSRNQ